MKKDRRVIILGEQGTLGIKPDAIPVLLNGYRRNSPLPKKVHELLVGYILVQFLNECQKETAIIGFPAKDGWKDHVQGRELNLIQHSEDFVRDADADIHISTRGMVRRYQITRYVFPYNQEPHWRFTELIRKKCRHQQPDSRLHLIVSIERTPKLAENELRIEPDGLQVPFGTILLLGKASPKRGHFQILQLYPKITIGKDVQTCLPV